MFILEVHKVIGEKYPPSTIRSLLSGISREITNNNLKFNILNKSGLYCTLDSVNSKLHRAGIGVKTKSAEVLSKECEELCWEKGTLGFSTPTVLQHTYTLCFAWTTFDGETVCTST